MKKTGSMTKKGKKESPAQNLVRELTTDHEVQSLGVSQGPSATSANVGAMSPEVQAAKKRKLILRTRQKSPVPAIQESEEFKLLLTTRYLSRKTKRLKRLEKLFTEREVRA